MRNWGLLLGFALSTVHPASAALVFYEVTLTTDVPSTAFGGGPAGEVFTGRVWFDDTAPLVPGPPGPADILGRDHILFDFDFHGSSFLRTSTAAPAPDVALLIEGGALQEILFNSIPNPAGDTLYIRTESGVDSSWTFTESGTGGTARGSTVPISVQFQPIPEPAVWTLGALAGLALLRRKRTG